MSITVCVNDIRHAWSRAKAAYWKENPCANGARINPQLFRDEFGKANGLTMVVAEFKAGFPVINDVEFINEQSYAWFLLRWQ